MPRGKFDSTNQKHYPDLGSDASSVWNFCARFSGVIWRGNQFVAKCRLFSQATLIPTKETKGTFSTPVLTGLGMRALDLSSLHAQKSSGSRLTNGRGKGRIECACATLALEFMLQSLLTIS